MALGGGGSPVKPRVANAGDNTVLHGMAGVVADQSLLELAAAGQCVVHNNNTNNNESTQGANTPPRRKCQPKICGILIQIFGLILTWIWMSTGLLPKCCGFIALSASVILPSFVKIGQ